MALKLLAAAAALTHAGALRLEKQGEPLEKCNWRTQTREDMCQWLRRDVALASYWKPLRVPRWGIRNMTALFQAVEKRLQGDPIYKEDFMRAWYQIKDLQACDVFAFKETWTFRDTDHLRTVTRGNFSAMNESQRLELKGSDDVVVSRLPVYKDFKRIIHAGDMAMISHGPGLYLNSHGAEIDDHKQVVRFNRIENSNLNADNTGLKHTTHVVNARMKAKEGSFVFDLEQDNFARSWCQRLFDGGDFPQQKKSFLFMWTPSAFCKTDIMFLNMFSREFLYYWFVGSLTNDVSLYGLMRNGTISHFNDARFHKAEQIVYEEIAKQWEAHKEAHPERIALNRRGKAVAGLAIRS